MKKYFAILAFLVAGSAFASAGPIAVSNVHVDRVSHHGVTRISCDVVNTSGKDLDIAAVEFFLYDRDNKLIGKVGDAAGSLRVGQNKRLVMQTRHTFDHYKMARMTMR